MRKKVVVREVNNAFYNDLKEKWQTALDHPVALLRAENRLRNQWISQFFQAPSTILDLGCGAGFLSNELSERGHQVVGVDLSESSLEMARIFDTTERVWYLSADATATPFPSESFDAVCAMDLLEHVENPQAVIREASRVLKPGGLFFFHTFNRTFWSWLIVIKGVEWFVKNTPSDMHVQRLFIKPEELAEMCTCADLNVQEVRGVGVKFASRPFWKMVLTREVPDDLEFVFTKSLKTGYSGVATKRSS